MQNTSQRKNLLGVCSIRRTLLCGDCLNFSPTEKEKGPCSSASRLTVESYPQLYPLEIHHFWRLPLCTRFFPYGSISFIDALYRASVASEESAEMQSHPRAVPRIYRGASFETVREWAARAMK